MSFILSLTAWALKGRLHFGLLWDPGIPGRTQWQTGEQRDVCTDGHRSRPAYGKAGAQEPELGQEPGRDPGRAPGPRGGVQGGAGRTARLQPSPAARQGFQRERVLRGPALRGQPGPPTGLVLSPEGYLGPPRRPARPQEGHLPSTWTGPRPAWGESEDLTGRTGPPAAPCEAARLPFHAAHVAAGSS